MACINRSLPGYKELAEYYGKTLTDALVRNNKMEIPTIEQAAAMIKANKILQFKHALNYLRNTTSASVDTLLEAMPRILQRKEGTIYVTKGSRLSEVPSQGAKENVETANIDFLKKVNEVFGSIFVFQKDYGLTNDQMIDAKAVTDEMLEADLIPAGYINMVKTDPIEFLRFVSQQGQNLDSDGNPNLNFDSTKPTRDSFGDVTVDYAIELFPYDRITNKKEVLAKLRELEGRSKAKKFPNIVDFVEAVIPKEYAEKYRDLYETAAKMRVPVNVEEGSVSSIFGDAIASFQYGTINIDPKLMDYYHDTWASFVETFNHEVIHGMISRGWGNKFQMNVKLKPLFDKVVANFDNASPRVQQIISTIVDASRDHPLEDHDAIMELPDWKEGDPLPETADLEEFITYGLTNPEFARFLDNIEYGKVNGKSKSVWQQLKDIIKDFFKSITSGSVLDNLTAIVEEHLNIEGPIKNYGKNIQPGERTTLDFLPAKKTGLATITGKEPLAVGTQLPTRLQSGVTTGFVEESLKVARDSNTTMASPYLTNAIYYAEGKVPGPASIPNNVVLPYANQKLANQLNKLKDQFQSLGSSKADKAKKEALKTKIFSIADQVYAEYKEALKANIRSIYDAWEPDLIKRSKHWYEGANRIAQNFANTYGLSVDATSGIIAVLSPQNEWFNNISAADRVMDIMQNNADTKVTTEMFDKALEQTGEEPFSIVVKGLQTQYLGKSINDVLSEPDIAANMLRVVDLATRTRAVAAVSPEGYVTGLKQSGGSDAKFAWGSTGEIFKAISIFKDPSTENISTRLGKGNKVRNFYNNIANPNSKDGEVTIDTHAAGVGLLNVISADDTASMGLFRNDSAGNSPLYAVLKESYQEVAKEKGLLPRELQSITWEAIRLLIDEASKTPANRAFINNIWKQVQQKKLTQDDAIKQIIGNFEFGRPEWAGTTDPGTNQGGLSEDEARLQQTERNVGDIRGQQPGAGTDTSRMAAAAIRPGGKLFNDPNPETAVIAEQYAVDNNIDYTTGEKIYKLNVDYAKRIADAFEAMEHQPNDPTVREAYQAMADETIKQYEAIKKAGYKIEVYTGVGEPYASSGEMIKDLVENKHMYIYATETGFGSTGTEFKKRDPNRAAKEEMVDEINQKAISRWGKPYFPSIDNPELDVLMANEVEKRDEKDCKANRCETNAYEVVKNNPDRYWPVKGYFITQTNFPVEHWWVYDRQTNKHVEITPNNPNENVPADYVKGYVGVIDKTLNDKIVKSDKVWDVDFFKSGRMFWNDLIEEESKSDNPLLDKTKYTDINGKPLLVNDLFRFVHDFFGHSERGNSFGPIGEENAWDVHARMYTPVARRAMTTETRGQNSWVNFGPQMRNAKGGIIQKGEPGYLSPKDRVFAEQKIGLMPEEFSSLPEEIGMERTGTKIADGTTRVTIDEKVLGNIAEENKKNVSEPTYTDPMPDAQYQKESGTEGYWEFEQAKRYALDNLIRMLSKKFNIPFEYDNTMNVAAKFSNGKIYLNLDKIGLDTPFHEIAHPFITLLKQDNPELYAALINELQSTEEGKAEIERVAQEYPELSPEEQLEEALVSLIGKNASEQFLNNPKTSTKQSLLQRFWQWVKEKLFGMGVNVSKFSPQTRIYEIAEMITNPMFSIDLARTQNLEDIDERLQKKASPQMQRDFDALIDDTIAKLKADVNIAGKTETEQKRKFFSGVQAKDLVNDRKDINALNSFITSGLFNLKDVNERFDAFKTLYESKGTKSKDDIRQMSLLLNEIEDNITLYSTAGPLLESIFEMFPDEKDNFSDWAYSLKREKRLMTEYQSWGVNVVADWLFPYYKKAIRKALASGNIFNVVSKEVYDNEVKLAKAEGITDNGVILERAVKQEIKNTLLIAKRDASGVTGYLAGVLNSRDSIASTVGQAVMDELHKALVFGQSVETRFKKLMKQYRGSTLFGSNQEEKNFYQKYLRQAKVWTYKGLGKDGKPTYEYVNRTAFHEEYEWDTFYNNKREAFEKILKNFGGKAPSKNDKVKFDAYKAQRDSWFAANTLLTKDAAGKDVRVPNAKYKNAQFAALMSTDPLFKEMYNTYKKGNEKLGKQGLIYGIVPQVKNEVPNPKGVKPRNVLEGVREWLGEQEQVYFVQSIAGGEKPVIPISHVKLLDEKDLSYNLINSVSKFAAASAKYESMRMIEPQVQILKNFIGGNNALNIKKRRTIKRSAAGIKSMSRMIHDEMFVESTKLNQQLDSFLNDAVYGQATKKQVIQIWDAKFEVWKTADKSVNGGPKVEKLHGFENVKDFTGLIDLDYSGFEFGKERQVGEWTVKMTQKDWNFSVKKTADRLGLLTALQTMIINPLSSTVNIIRGKTESFVESLGGRYFTPKDFAFGEAEYWKALGSGDFFEDMKGGKPSFLSSMLIDYDALQGELMDASGRKLERGLANKFFRSRRLFFMQNGGEHYIQTQLMIAMMNHQKVKLNAGGTISLYEARKQEYEGKLKLADTDWNEERNREFRETLAEVNTRLNGNYNKTDKAMIQRTWWGAALMMFRKHIYNGFANRYRKGYVNYQTGDVTEGYWRTFATALTREIGEAIRDRNIRKFNLNEQEKYAFRKFGGDVIALGLFIAMFKMFDDDDDDNEFSDDLAVVFRRLVSEGGQYTPVIAPLELGKMVKNPSAITHTVNSFYEAFKQTLSDPTEEYERTGPGYEEGDNKAWKKWQRAIPGWRIVLNTQEPERLLQFYQQNSLGFLKPSAGKESEEESGNDNE